MTHNKYTFQKDGIQIGGYHPADQRITRQPIPYEFGNDTVLVDGKVPSPKQPLDLAVEAARKD